MTDARLLPANGRVAAAELKGSVKADRYVDGTAAMVARPCIDLLRSPDGPRDRQLVYGEVIRVLEDTGGWAFVQARKDGYVGYLSSTELLPPVDPTHRVSVTSTILLKAPAVQASDVVALPFGSKLRITGGADAFYETHDGLFVPRSHVRPDNRPFNDPTTVAQMFFGAPYLWGGNTVWGIDCSGLVQAALIACDIPCPGDSDLQQSLGHCAEPPYVRGDLLFWKGHVGIAVDDQVMIHANAHAMAVAYEPISDAIARIEAQGEGPMTAHRRLGL